MIPLMFASQNGHRDIAALLLEKGADVSAKRKDDATALTLAKARSCMKQHEQTQIYKPWLSCWNNKGKPCFRNCLTLIG